MNNWWVSARQACCITRMWWNVRNPCPHYQMQPHSQESCPTEMSSIRWIVPLWSAFFCITPTIAGKPAKGKGLGVKLFVGVHVSKQLAVADCWSNQSFYDYLYLTEVSSLVRGWLRVHAIFSYLPLLSLVGTISFRWYLLCQLSRYFLVGHGIFCLLSCLLLVVFVMCYVLLDVLDIVVSSSWIVSLFLCLFPSFSILPRW